jgi:hypothetical protein
LMYRMLHTYQRLCYVESLRIDIMMMQGTRVVLLYELGSESIPR